MGESMLFWAIQNGLPKHVSEVPNGLACGCICSGCGATLMAKHGKIKAHHFAHYNKDACNYTGETAIHLAAKEIIKSRGYIVLPPPFFERNEPEKYTFDSLSLEAQYADFIPDVLAEIDGKIYVIEIAVTHFVDAAKKAKIAASGAFGAIEINLSHSRNISRAELEKTVIESTIDKKWICHPEIEANKARQRNFAIAKKEQAEKEQIVEKERAEKERIEKERIEKEAIEKYERKYKILWYFDEVLKGKQREEAFSELPNILGISYVQLNRYVYADRADTGINIPPAQLLKIAEYLEQKICSPVEMEMLINK
jgi:hypothetical protein